MERKKEHTEPANLIKIAEKDLSVYAWAVVLKGQPYVYQKYGEIKIQVTRNRIEKANQLIELFKHWGLEEVKREPCKILVTPPKKNPYYLTEAFEITLRKIGALTDW